MKDKMQRTYRDAEKNYIAAMAKEKANKRAKSKY